MFKTNCNPESKPYSEATESLFNKRIDSGASFECNLGLEKNIAGQRIWFGKF